MSKKFTSDSPDLAEIRRLKKPNKRSVTLLLDTEVAKQIADLEKEIRRERRKDEKENRAPVVPGLEKKLDALKEAAIDDEVEFVFVDIGRKKFDGILDKHPPSDEIKELEPAAEWDPETFPPALIAACSYEPEISEEQALEIWDEWSQAETQALFMGALGACLERASIPFTKTDTGVTDDFVSSLISVESTESPTDTSLAGT